MAKRLFVTATGTDIGKTYISGLIVKKMRNFGLNCGYFKPVLSGAYVSNGKIIPGDCDYVIKKSQLNIEPSECLSYCFKEPVSPHLAAVINNIEINPDKILSDYEKLSKNYDYMLIEGAGGITCPVICNDEKTFLMSDLIKDFKTDVIIIADGGLGTINSVLTTDEYIKTHGINTAGIILNNYDKNNYMHNDNLKMIERLSGLKVIATVKKDEQDLNVDTEVLKGLFK